MRSVFIAIILAALLTLAESSQSQFLIGIPLPVWCTAIAFLIQWIAFIPAYWKQTEKFYDLTGSLTYITLVLFLLASTENLSTRDYLLAMMVLIWAIRLGSFLFARIIHDGSDGRFDSIKPDPIRFLGTWTLQGLWVIVTAACAFTAIASESKSGLDTLDFVAIAIWLLGFLIESVADAQKRAFRKSFGHSRFIDTGLWRYSQHPNYFGEILLWIGVALLALPALQGWQHAALVSPLFIYLLLTRVSGIPLLQARAKKRWQDNEDYRRYTSETSLLIPRPPTKRH